MLSPDTGIANFVSHQQIGYVLQANAAREQHEKLQMPADSVVTQAGSSAEDDEFLSVCHSRNWAGNLYPG